MTRWPRRHGFSDGGPRAGLIDGSGVRIPPPDLPPADPAHRADEHEPRRRRFPAIRAVGSPLRRHGACHFSLGFLPGIESTHSAMFLRLIHGIPHNSSPKRRTPPSSGLPRAARIATQFNDVLPHGAGAGKPPLFPAMQGSLHLSPLFKWGDSSVLAENAAVFPLFRAARSATVSRKSKDGCAITPTRWSFRTTSHHPPQQSDEDYRSTFSSRYSFRTTAWSPSPGLPVYTSVIRPFWANSASRSMASTR